ncbi:MAG: PEGA domain-containing protein [Anaeromyxobacter sp.]
MNGQDYGRAPCELLVPAGRYDVRVTSGATSIAKRVEVNAGTREVYPAIFEAQ